MNNDLVAKLLWRISQDADLVANNPDVRALNNQMKNVKDSSRLTVSDDSASNLDTTNFWRGQYDAMARRVDEANDKIGKLEIKVQKLESQKSNAKADALTWKRHYHSFYRPTSDDGMSLEDRVAQNEEWAEKWDAFILAEAKAKKWEALQAMLKGDDA